VVCITLNFPIALMSNYANACLGGISFFSSRLKSVCDSVQKFEVVIASGAIINANAHENHVLFQALKGGSNNFGIVTRFDIKAFSQKNFYGGQIITPEVPGVPSTVPGKVKGFASLANRDRYVAAILSFGWTPLVTLFHTVLQYTKEGIIDPPHRFNESGKYVFIHCRARCRLRSWCEVDLYFHLSRQQQKMPVSTTGINT
jgi:hypothetical protein